MSCAAGFHDGPFDEKYGVQACTVCGQCMHCYHVEDGEECCRCSVEEYAREYGRGGSLSEVGR